VIEQTYGQCRLCGKRFKKPGMQRHVRACRARMAGSGAGSDDGLLLALEDRHLSSYWLVVEASPAATWDDLDAFLRRIWVECCGHLSSFQHAGRTFAYDVDGASEWAADPRSMAERIAGTVGAGSRFRYEYDFGTTTELVGRALDVVPGAPRGPTIEVLARNEPPVHPCAECGQGATTVCALCYQRLGDLCWYCDACVQHHRCSDPDGDYVLPVVNSPRVGLCGYGGPAEG
jgi:hypothetical protein